MIHKLFLYSISILLLWGCSKSIVPYGKLSYAMTYEEFGQALNKTDSMFVYFSDKGVRTENLTPLGYQVHLSPIDSANSYLLMEVHGRAVAISLPEKKDSISFISQKGKKNILGYSCKLVESEDIENKMIVHYTTQINPIANNKFESIDGVPLDYTLKDKNSSVHFTAVELDTNVVSDDLFVIPEYYQIMTFEAFMNVIR